MRKHQAAEQHHQKLFFPSLLFQLSNDDLDMWKLSWTKKKFTLLCQHSGNWGQNEEVEKKTDDDNTKYLMEKVVFDWIGSI